MPASHGHFTLYGFHLSMPAAKVALMLSMSGQPFDYVQVDRAYRDTNAEWKTLSRWGEVPTLTHDRRVLVQSNTILRYLARVTGAFGPKDEAAEQRVSEWLEWNGDRFKDVNQIRFFGKTGTGGKDLLDYIRPRAEKALTTLDDHFAAGNDFILGQQPTICDIACFPSVMTAPEGGLEHDRWPRLKAWTERMLAQPGCKHPYDMLPDHDRKAA
ncbi:MAG: glutathione S-transferase family protein [Alphaproteobacteria bacterium]